MCFKKRNRFRGPSIAVITLLIFFAGSSNNAATIKPIEINPDFGNLQVLTQSRFLKDTGSRSIAEIQAATDWQKTKRNKLFLGIIDDTVWVNFKLKNTNNFPAEFFLQSEDPLTTYLDIYFIGADRNEHFKLGVSQNFSARDFPDRSFVQPLNLKAGEVIDIYYRYRSVDPISISLIAMDSARLWNKLQSEGAFLWIYIGFLVVMFIYNLFMFISTREKVFLYYLYYLTAYAATSVAYTGIGNQYLWPEAPLIGHFSIPVTITLTTITLFLFTFELVAEGDHKRVDYLWAVQLSMGLYVAVVIWHMFTMEWAFTTNLFVIMIMPMSVIGSAIVIYFAFTRNSRPAKFLVYAFSIFFIGLFIVLLKNLDLMPDNRFTQHAYLWGSAAQITMVALVLADRMNIMKMNIETAERKYRHLVEDANEIIFTLDKNGVFTSVNRLVRKVLRFDPKDLMGKKLIELVQEMDAEQTELTRELIERSLDTGEIREPINLTVPLRSKHGIEPTTVSIRLQKAIYEGEIETIGKAIVKENDLALEFLDSEEQSYFLNNFLKNAQLMSFHLTNNVARYVKKDDVAQLRLCLREMLINAIEHGNLGISFDQKTQTQANHTYFEFLKERQKQEPYRSRRVRIDYSLNAQRIKYRITDEGEGFDHSRIVNLGADANALLLEHGRGIWMTSQVYDEVEFNQQGNQVTLVKKFGT